MEKLFSLGLFCGFHAKELQRLCGLNRAIVPESYSSITGVCDTPYCGGKIDYTVICFIDREPWHKENEVF